VATTDEEIRTLRAANQERRNKILAANVKAEKLMRLVENDAIKAKLEKEAAKLDRELAIADKTVDRLIEQTSSKPPKVSETSVKPVISPPVVPGVPSTGPAGASSATKSAK